MLLGIDLWMDGIVPSPCFMWCLLYCLHATGDMCVDTYWLEKLPYADYMEIHATSKYNVMMWCYLDSYKDYWKMSLDDDP